MSRSKAFLKNVAKTHCRRRMGIMTEKWRSVPKFYFEQKEAVSYLWQLFEKSGSKRLEYQPKHWQIEAQAQNNRLSTFYSNRKNLGTWLPEFGRRELPPGKDFRKKHW